MDFAPSPDEKLLADTLETLVREHAVAPPSEPAAFLQSARLESTLQTSGLPDVCNDQGIGAVAGALGATAQACAASAMLRPTDVVEKIRIH